MSDNENNGSNGSANTANNTPATPEISKPEVTSSPAPENNPTPENSPAPEAPVNNPKPVKDEPAKTEDKPAEASSSEGVNYTPPQASTETPSVTDNVVEFSITGNTNISGKVPTGTKISDAVAKLGGSITGLSLRDADNKMVYGTAIINGPMKLTASTRASGG